ncbi:MAG: hypothetical protein JSU04_06580 [Bdellovibrionales bacterium]|nr:hypothetical protein [Bdellovibrionales bacterium]
MTKYAFYTLQLFLFCFIAFDFSEAFAASADTSCVSSCDSWNYQCISACRGGTAQTTSASRVRPRSAKSTASAKPKAKATPDQTCDITCSIPGQEPQRIGGKCGCYYPADYEGIQGNQNQNSGNTNSPALTDAVNKCNEARTQALNDCDQDQDTGMQGAQSALTNFASQAGAMGMGACTKLAPVLAGANAATVYFNQNCSSGRTSCMKTCTTSATNLRQMAGTGIDGGYLAQQQGLVDSYYDECKKLDSKVAQSQQAIQGMVQAIPGVSSCATATNTDLYSYCTANPTALGCETAATDCSNPQVAASNQICICKNNPNASGCIGAQAKVSDMGTAGSADVSSLASNAGAGSASSDSPFSTLGWDGNGMTPSKDKAGDIGGKMGKGANLGDGGGGAPGAGGDGKGGAAAQAAQVNAGFRGGGGGGGGWGNGGGYGGYGDDRPYDPKDPKAAAAGGPDLKQFLPGGKMDPKTANRGLAGISGPDGITGPHSDIWKKIQNRYQIKTSELMP